MTMMTDYRTALENRGWVLEKQLARGISMKHPQHKFKFYLGLRGSLRKGQTRSGSVPVGRIWFADFLDGLVG